MNHLDQRILSELEMGPLSNPELAIRVGEDPQVVKECCEGMRRDHHLNLLMKATEDDVRDSRDIVRFLRENGRQSTTSDLAAKTKMKPNQALRRCKRLQMAGILRSEKRRSERSLFFFPTSGDVITQTNYEDIQKLIDRLRSIAQQYQLPRKVSIPDAIKEDLRKQYRIFLREYATDLSPRQQKQVRAFEKELMTTLNDTNLSDILQRIGLRRFSPKILIWILMDTPPGGGEVLAGDVIWGRL